MPRNPSLSSPSRVSAISFDWTGASSYSPPRSHLTASASSPALSRAPGKRIVPLYSQRTVEADNFQLADVRARTIAYERKREIQDDLTRNGDWGARWGFAHKTSHEDLRSRRRPHPDGGAHGKPSLVGCGL